MENIVEIIGLTAFCGLKFFFAIPAVVLKGYSFWETIGIAVTGGLISFFIFFYFGEFLKMIFIKYFRKKDKPSKKFNRRNRFIITIKGKYGLIGLAVITPIILSVPLGSILAGRYFDTDRKTIPFMTLSIVLWAFALSLFYHMF